MGRGNGNDSSIGRRQTTVAQLPYDELRSRIEANAAALAELGEWPQWIPPQSILERVPTEDDHATGFDAGIACTLGLIPADKQKLAARLHAAYTPEAVAQVRTEIEALDADSETCWWLAGCACCTEGRVDVDTFRGQIARFEELVAYPQLRLAAAKECLDEMLTSYEIHPELAVAFGAVDGCMQGSYLGGHDLATMLVPAEDEEDDELYFIGTFLPSLGLEEFEWSSLVDDKGRPRSGPVHGSRQFVKCATYFEFARAVIAAKQTLGISDPRLQA